MVILETGCLKFHCFSVIFLNKMRGDQRFLGKHTQSGSRYFSFICFHLFHPVELICPHRSTTNPILFRLIPTQNSHLNPLFSDHFMNSQFFAARPRKIRRPSWAMATTTAGTPGSTAWPCSLDEENTPPNGLAPWCRRPPYLGVPVERGREREREKRERVHSLNDALCVRLTRTLKDTEPFPTLFKSSLQEDLPNVNIEFCR